MTREIKGYLLIVISASLWGFSGALVKYFFNQALSPLVLVNMRLTLSAALLLSYLYLKRPHLLMLAGGDRKKMVLFGVLGVAGMQFCYLHTISQMNVAAAVFLLTLSPVFVTLHALLWEKEPLKTVSIIALLLACTGSALIVTDQVFPGVQHPLPGIITGFGSAVAYAFYTIYGKSLLTRYCPWTVLAYGFLFAAVPFWFLIPPWVVLEHHFGWQIWLFFLYTSVFATIIPFGFYLKGLQNLKPYCASITGTLEPVLAGVFAYFLLGETLSGWQMIGCSLILTAVIILQTEPHFPRPLPTARIRKIPW